MHSIQEQIEASKKLIISSFRNKKKLMVCGNGGSAADSLHIVGELQKSFKIKRPLELQIQRKLSALYGEDGVALASKLCGGLPAISLVSEVALSTAIVNDMDSTMIFAQSLVSLGQAGDTLLAISTSGNSKNVISAAKVARAMDISVIGLTGRSGGTLEEFCDVCIKVDAMETDKIQECHLPVYHQICAEIESYFFGE
jgi:D-sedoheptulose 7-phosphate isomerase